MPQFRWPEMKHDIALAKEVASVRPSKPADWEVIAGVLSAAFSTDDKPITLLHITRKTKLKLSNVQILPPMQAT